MIRYFFPEHDEAGFLKNYPESDEWFPPPGATPPPVPGATALAAIIMVGAFGGWQDDPAGSLLNYPESDEHYSTPSYVTPPAPVSGATCFAAINTVESYEEWQDDPAGKLNGQPEEYFYQPPRPWPLTTAQPALDPDEVPAGNLKTWIAEEHHPPLALMLPAPLTGATAFAAIDQVESLEGYQDELPTSFSPDEDLYQPPRPWPLTTAQPALEQDDPSGFLANYPGADEDFYVPPVPPGPPLPRVFLDDSDFVAQVTFQPDEDLYVPPLPWPLATARPFLDDPDVPPLSGQPDEDLYQPPRPWPLTTAKPALEQDDFWAQVAFQPDEDLYVPPAPWPLTTARPFLDTDDPAGSLLNYPEADEWLYQPPRPWPLTTARSFLEADDAWFQPPPFHTDEDFLPQCAIPPPTVPANLVALYGWSRGGDPEEIPAGFTPAVKIFGGGDVTRADRSWSGYGEQVYSGPKPEAPDG